MENEQFFSCNAAILILENSSSDLSIFIMALRHCGYNVRNVRSVEAVQQLLIKKQYDMIIIDISINTDDRYEFCETIKSDNKTKETPIIFINSIGCDIDKERVFAVGGADYITFPFIHSEIFTRIETHLKLSHLKLKNKKNDNTMKTQSKTYEELLAENEVLERTLQERTLQLQDITSGLKEFNVLLEEEITERTKTEEALKESERQFRNAIEKAPVPIILHAGDGEIIKLSRAWTDLTGYTISDLPNMFKFLDVAEIINGGLDDFNLLEGFDNRNRRNDGIYSIKTRDGETRIFGFYTSHIGKLLDGRSLFSKIAVDITERKRLVELKEYDRIKTEFFSNISHELRTPINVIFSALQMFEVKHKECNCQLLSCNKLKYVKIMKQNCYRLLRLINNLIDITKIDSGYYDIKKVNVNIISLIENITLSVVDYIQSKGLNLVFDTTIEEKIIACDFEKIERIILNLLANSVKFTPSGGNITVTIEDCIDNICVSVKDTGRGIPEDKLNSIFERFVQVDKSLARDHEGSGIGLSLVKCLVQLHGGTISVKSSTGYGTEFSIYFPCILEDEISSEATCIDLFGENYVEKINIEFSDIYN